MFLVLTEMSTFTSIIKLFLLLVLFFCITLWSTFIYKMVCKIRLCECEVIEYTNYRDAAGSSG